MNDIIHEKRMSRLTLMVLVGNMGAGKSTYAKDHIEHGYVSVSLDGISQSLMAGISGVLHGAAYNRLCRKLYEYTIYEALNSGVSVIADDLNLRSADRAYLCKIAKGFNAQTLCVDFGSGSQENLERRCKASSTFNYQGFDIMFQDFKKKYEKPTQAEGFDIILQ